MATTTPSPTVIPPGEASWPELLKRLSEAAFYVHEKEFRRNGVKKASKILQRPAKESHIAALEAEVGELPADFKEMLRHSNGYRGGWHVLGGGIAGTKHIELSDCYDVEHLFNVPPSDLYTREDGQVVSVYTVTGEPHFDDKVIRLVGYDDSDGICIYIIPHAVWRRRGDMEAKDGEYRVVQHTNWGGGDDFKSFHDYLAQQCGDLEGMVGRGEKANDQDGIDEEEEGSVQGDKFTDGSTEEEEDDDEPFITAVERKRRARMIWLEAWTIRDLSAPLQNLVGPGKMTRMHIGSKIIEYVRDNNLRDPSDQNVAVCDQKMREVFEVDRLNLFEMRDALTKHLSPLDEATT